MKQTLLLTVGSLWLVAISISPGCQKEVVEPEYKIEGYYVLDDGSNLTDQYIVFKDATLSVFNAYQKLIFIEDKLWNTTGMFSNPIRSHYSIQNGVLKSEIWVDTPIKLENNVLTLGTKKYTAWSGQSVSPCYSGISVHASKELSYAAQLDSIPYSITHPIPFGHLTVSSSESWLTVEEVNAERILIRLNENNTGSDRQCRLQLGYDGGTTATCLVTQKWAAPTFSLTPASQDIDYVGGDFSFSFTVDNLREGMVVTVTSQVNWITDVTLTGNTISYKVAENNSGAQRSGNIRLDYGSLATKDFQVIQSYSASSISVNPSSQNVPYTAGNFSFAATIENPREGASLSASSQANWITVVSISGNIVSYEVAENNSGSQRSGIIRLDYGSFATKDFQVIQSYSASSISVNPSSQNVPYTAGNFSFAATIENPREGASLSASSQANWIIEVSVSGNTVSYKVAENNSGAQRSGNIRLNYGDFTSSVFAVTQNGCPVTSLQLNKSNLSLNPGQSEKLIATVSPADATLTWSTGSTSIATVGQDGTVTAIGNGTTTVMVSSSDGQKTASCTVSVTTPVTGVSLNKTTLALNPGGSETLTATITPSTASNKSVSWKSSNTSVATVTASGLVSAVANGTSTITVTTSDGQKTATCTVTVTTPVSGVSLNKSTLNLTPGGSETLSVTITPSTASNKSVTWKSSNTTVATVSTTGLVSAVADGTATITVTTANGEKTASCTVTVTTPVTGVSLNKSSLGLTPGGSEILEATISPSTASNKSVSWKSSNTTVATVTASGLVSAVAKGTSTITVTTVDGGKTASCTVTVVSGAVAVDLGLSVLWSPSNLSSSGLCTNPQDYGDYYAWGETEPKSDYSWATYALCKGSATTLIKYNNKSSNGAVDHKTEFKDYNYEDDAARTKLGGKWRMPTDAEWTELRNSCTWGWTSNYNGTGVAGRVVSASNGNSIFLPAAGTHGQYAGSHGYYWSSSLYVTYPSGAWCITFASGGVSRDHCYRRDGYPVRPVLEK